MSFSIHRIPAIATDPLELIWFSNICTDKWRVVTQIYLLRMFQFRHASGLWSTVTCVRWSPVSVDRVHTPLSSFSISNTCPDAVVITRSDRNRTHLPGLFPIPERLVDRTRAPQSLIVMMKTDDVFSCPIDTHSYLFTRRPQTQEFWSTEPFESVRVFTLKRCIERCALERGDHSVMCVRRRIKGNAIFFFSAIGLVIRRRSGKKGIEMRTSIDMHNVKTREERENRVQCVAMWVGGRKQSRETPPLSYRTVCCLVLPADAFPAQTPTDRQTGVCRSSFPGIHKQQIDRLTPVLRRTTHTVRLRG